jgi:tRNA(Ile)-lysidine synthase
MKAELKPGKYAVAVSGGVDSVVLLDLLHNLPDVRLVVAHFDHGIREDSAEDREFVQRLAERYGLPFEHAEGRLGPMAGEAKARTARYNFLEKVMKLHQAQAIVTAHHEDDMLETAIINLLRGTGRKGLSALDSTNKLERPLLHFSKEDILKYARAHDLKWREDSTNQEEAYLRNYIRRRLLPRFSEPDRQKLLELVKQSKVTNRQLDDLLGEELRQHSDGKRLDKRWFSRLPHAVALEVMAAWLRRQDLRSFDRGTLERLAVAAKTSRPGQRFDVMKGVIMEAEKDDLALGKLER